MGRHREQGSCRTKTNHSLTSCGSWSHDLLELEADLAEAILGFDGCGQESYRKGHSVVCGLIFCCLIVVFLRRVNDIFNYNPEVVFVVCDISAQKRTKMD